MSPETSQRVTADTLYEKELSKAAGNAGIAGLGELINVALRYVTGVVMTRGLGAEGFGVYALALTVAQLTGALARTGLDYGVLRYVALYEARKDRIHRQGILFFATLVSSSLGLALGIVLFLSAAFLSTRIFHGHDLASPLKLFALSIPLVSVQAIWLGGLQGLQRIKDRVYIEKLIDPALRLGLVVAFLALGFGVLGAVSAWIISTIVATLVALRYVTGAGLLALPNSVETKIEAKDWLLFSAPLFLMSILAFALTEVDTLMLGYLRSAEEVGVYNVALKVAPLVAMPLLAFNMIFAPMISSIYGAGEANKLQALFKSVTKWTFSLSFVIFLIVSLFTEPILGIFGAEFKVAGLALRILACGYLIDAGVGAVGYMLMMTGHSQINLINTALMGTLNVALNYALIPRYGIIGASIGTGLTIAAINLLRLGEVYYFLGIHPFRLDFLKPLLAGLLAALLIWSFQSRMVSQPANRELGFPLLPILILILVATYLFLLWGLRLSRDDKAILRFVRHRLGIGLNRWLA